MNHSDSIPAQITAGNRPLDSRIVFLLLLTQAGLLAYSATRHSPTDLEPAFLASGLSHWEFGRFEAYRVNPPLARMVAAIPVVAVGYKSDWSKFYEGPGARPEFSLGDSLIKANGKEVIPLVTYARWACIPFSLMGAFFACRWASELYGPAAGLVTLILFVFEPNLLAHGELVTPDSACTAFGIMAGYTFWQWLKQPTWSRAAWAGAALGLAELSKMSWLILFGLWPVLALIWRWLEPKPVDTDESTNPSYGGPFWRWLSQLTAILVLAVYLMNLGYAFDGTGTPLKDFQFVSTALTGLEKPGTPGNRFRDTWLGQIPVPLPSQYVLGFDSQKKDFEHFGHRSFLRGEWKDSGWWYYYLYGLLVKVPCGTWGLLAIVMGSRMIQGMSSLLKNGDWLRRKSNYPLIWRQCEVPIPLFQQAVRRGERAVAQESDRVLLPARPVPLRDELVLLVPALTLIALVSSQTEFSIHLRYVFPSLGLFLIFIGQAGKYLRRSSPLRATAVCAALFYTVMSCLLVYPNHLAYFNDFVGGPQNGHKHLLGSSLDWGQGTQEAITWIKENEPTSKVEFSLYSATLAAILLEQTQEGGSPPQRTETRDRRLILYSADRYSDIARRSNEHKNPPIEEVVKRFPSGRVLVRVVQ